MADESLNLPSDHNIDFHIVTLFERLDAIRKDGLGPKFMSTIYPKFNMQAEIRTLEFWRSIISECLSSFFYIFIVCGAAAGSGIGSSVSSVLLATSLSSGFAITALTQCFLHVSGANINPSVTIALVVIRQISPLRAFFYITAQCSGGIAASALLYSVTVPGYQGNLQAAISHSQQLVSWERFAVEFILTFVVVLVYIVSTDTSRRHFGSSALAIGAAYSACSFVSMPYLNPARSLGPSFVLNKWDNHWIYWLGPLSGGAVSGFLYEYVFNPKRYQKNKRSSDNDTSSVQSDEDLNYDFDLEKTTKPHTKFHSSNYNTNKTVAGPLQQTNEYCQSMYSGPPPTKTVDRGESLYGGTRSLYCKSPPLTRANLNRSQSVYAKSNSAINRDIGPLRAGPLVPAQSLYPMKINQPQNTSHVQNQNVLNQLQQRSESIYGIRGSIRQQQQEPHSFQPIYGTRNACDGLKYDRGELQEDQTKVNRKNRPESMYGITAGQRRGQSQSTQSDDSSYGSYHGSNVTPITGKPTMLNGENITNYAGLQTRNPQTTERKISTNNPSQSLPRGTIPLYNQKQQQQQPQHQQQTNIANTGYNLHQIRQN